MASSCVRERSRGLDVLGFQVPEVLSREGTEPGWPTWWVSAVVKPYLQSALQALLGSKGVGHHLPALPGKVPNRHLLGSHAGLWVL